MLINKLISFNTFFNTYIFIQSVQNQGFQFIKRVVDSSSSPLFHDGLCCLLVREKRDRINEDVLDYFKVCKTYSSMFRGCFMRGSFGNFHVEDGRMRHDCVERFNSLAVGKKVRKVFRSKRKTRRCDWDEELERSEGIRSEPVPFERGQIPQVTHTLGRTA